MSWGVIFMVIGAIGILIFGMCTMSALILSGRIDQEQERIFLEKQKEKIVRFPEKKKLTQPS